MNDLYIQIKEIKELLDLANQDVGEIKWEGHHPDYPKSITNLMSCIARSDWMYSDYQDFQIEDIESQASDADLQYVMATITKLQRTERWCTGGWIDIFKKRHLDHLVNRAIHLVEPI